MFRNQKLASMYKPARYHILLAVRLLANNAIRPRMNAREMERYCKVITDQLWDYNRADELFAIAVGLIDEVAEGNFDRDNIRTEDFTRQIIAGCREQGRENTSG